jgi:hypothetical protein
MSMKLLEDNFSIKGVIQIHTLQIVHGGFAEGVVATVKHAVSLGKHISVSRNTETLFVFVMRISILVNEMRLGYTK